MYHRLSIHKELWRDLSAFFNVMLTWAVMFQSICHSSEAIHLCASARSPVGGVSTRYKYRYIWSEHLKKIAFSFTPEILLRWWWRWCSELLSALKWNCFGRYFSYRTAPDNFSQLTIGRAHNKDAGKMAKLFADALLLTVSLLNIFTVGKWY